MSLFFSLHYAMYLQPFFLGILMDSQIAVHNVYYGSVAINLEKYMHAGRSSWSPPRNTHSVA
jgi:hypothetical protein